MFSLKGGYGRRFSTAYFASDSRLFSYQSENNIEASITACTVSPNDNSPTLVTHTVYPLWGETGVSGENHEFRQSLDLLLSEASKAKVIARKRATAIVFAFCVY